MSQAESVAATGCELSAWSEWGPCSATCGPDATTTRSRVVMTEADVEAAADLQCANFPLTEELGCPNPVDCPDEPCLFTEWSPWSDCSISCWTAATGTQGLPLSPPPLIPQTRQQALRNPEPEPDDHL